MIEWCGRASGCLLGTKKPAETIYTVPPACLAGFRAFKAPSN